MYLSGSGKSASILIRSRTFNFTFLLRSKTGRSTNFMNKRNIEQGTRNFEQGNLHPENSKAAHFFIQYSLFLVHYSYSLFLVPCSLFNNIQEELKKRSSLLGVYLQITVI